MHLSKPNAMKTLFVTDLDGTLLQPDATLSQDTRDILHELLAKGFPLTIATARTMNSVLPMLAGLPFRLPLILQNGAVLYDMQQKKIVDAAGIGTESYCKVCDLFAEYGFIGFVFCVPDGKLACCYTELRTEHMRSYYAEHANGGARFMQVTDYHELAARTPVFLSVNAPHENLDALHAELQQIAGIAVAYYRDVYEPEIWYLEVTAPEASKYHGICKVKEMCRADHVTGFGDNRNDFPLFAACDLKIAVGNADAALKERADLIIGRNTENAVAHYLRAQFQNHI